MLDCCSVGRAAFALHLRYDFHHDSTTHCLKRYRACQQDAVFFTGRWLFGGCDGSADRKHERMGAGTVLTEGSMLAAGRQLRFALSQWPYPASYNNSRESRCTPTIDCIYRLPVLASVYVQVGENKLLAWS